MGMTHVITNLIIVTFSGFIPSYPCGLVLYSSDCYMLTELSQQGDIILSRFI